MRGQRIHFIQLKQIDAHLIKNVSNLIPVSVILNSIDLKILLGTHTWIDVIYPGVSKNLDMINKF